MKLYEKEDVMNIYTTKEKLPASAEEYFKEYRYRARNEMVAPGDLEKILSELRLAYEKYTKNRPRIKAIAAVVKSGLKAKLPKKSPKQFIPPKEFYGAVKDSLS